MLAVSHFAAGAMENWGLMIFREATLIWDPITGTELARQKVATVISHEIAHQVLVCHWLIKAREFEFIIAVKLTMSETFNDSGFFSCIL